MQELADRFPHVTFAGPLVGDELIANPAVRNLIREGKTYQIPSAMQTGKKYGMQTLDDAIMDLLKKTWISAEDAYMYSTEKQKFVGFLKKPPVDFTEV